MSANVVNVCASSDRWHDVNMTSAGAARDRALSVFCVDPDAVEDAVVVLHAGPASRPSRLGALQVHAVLALQQFIFAAMVVFTKYALAYIPPLLFGTLRALVALPCLLAIVWLRGVPLWPYEAESWRKPALKLLVLGCVGIAANQMFVMLALKLVSATNVAIFQPAAPVFTSAMSMALGRERPSVLKVCGIALAVTGALIMLNVESLLSSGDGAMQWGNVFLLCNTLCFSAYLLRQRSFLQQYGHPLPTTLWVVTAGGAVMCLLSTPHTVSWAHLLAHVPWKAWAGVLYAGVMASCLAYLLTSWALTRTSASVVSLYICVQPLASALLANVLLGERVSRREMIGGPLIVGALGLMAWAKRRDDVADAGEEGNACEGDKLGKKQEEDKCS